MRAGAENVGKSALALLDLADDLVRFQKNDFWYRVRGRQKSFFLKLRDLAL